MIFNQVLVATMMMLAASASFDDVAVSAAVRGLKLGKNGPPPPGPKKSPKKIPAPILIPPLEPTDTATAEPLLDIPDSAFKTVKIDCLINFFN